MNLHARVKEEGWQLGLQPLNGSVGVVRDRDRNDSLSFNTVLSGSPVSSTDSSSDVDAESTGSFLHDKGVTLGSLIGPSSILELTRRSTRGRIAESVRNKKNYKSKAWFTSLCSRLSTDAMGVNNAPSLGHFLAAERRAASSYRRNQITGAYVPDKFSHDFDTNSICEEEGRVNDQPQSSSWLDSNGETVFHGDLFQHSNGDETPLLRPCLCGNFTN